MRIYYNILKFSSRAYEKAFESYANNNSEKGFSPENDTTTYCAAVDDAIPVPLYHGGESQLDSNIVLFIFSLFCIL